MSKKIEWKTVLPIVISMATLAWTIIHEATQDKKIAELNEPRIAIDNTFMQYFDIISQHTFDTTKWGYSWYCNSLPDDTYRIPYTLMTRDSLGHPLKADHGFTMSAIQKQLKEIGYKGKFTLYKIYHPVINLKNIGPTVANKLQTIVDIRYAPYPSNRWENNQYANIALDLNPNEEVNPTIEIPCRGDLAMPDTVYFRFSVTFMDTNKKLYSQILYTCWEQRRNQWGRFSSLDE